MCTWGTSTDVEVTIPADLSHTGQERRAVKPIDSCIASIVKALDAAGIVMRGSCCGHGKGSGEILLNDGRVLTIQSSALAPVSVRSTVWLMVVPEWRARFVRAAAPCWKGEIQIGRVLFGWQREEVADV